MSDIAVKTAEAAGYISSRIKRTPRLGVILGSGLGTLADILSGRTAIPYQDIPNFPISTVKGHEGNLICGGLSGVHTAVMQGRFHHYEGYFMRDITFPVRVLSQLGVKVLIVTNASGGIRNDLLPGVIAVVADHINLMGTNPLIGHEVDDGGGEMFLDLSAAYDRELIDIASDVLSGMGEASSKVVLAAVHGPCYETPAEVRMLGSLGADAVCMSSVPEVIMARYLGLRVLGLTLVTNRAAGLSDTPPKHDEVLAVAGSRHEAFAKLVESIAGRIAGAGIV